MRRARVILLGALVLLTSACRIDTTVDIAVDDDGSGVVTVTLEADAEATAALGGTPDSLRFDDLVDAGWTVEGPETTAAGSTVVASKPFPDAESLPGVLAELAGEGIVFRDVALEKDHSFDWIGFGPAVTDYTLTGTVDPTPPIEAFADDFLPAGVDLGQRVDDIAAGLAAGDELHLDVSVRLPGTESTDTGEVVGEAAVWELSYGDEAVALDARSSVEDIMPRVWATVTLLAVLVLVAVIVARLWQFVLAQMRIPKGRRRRDVRSRQRRAASREAQANTPRRRMLRLLVVDVHGVLVRPTDPVGGLLLPLVLEYRADADPDRVRELHRRLVLGRMSVEEFWSDIGLGPVADEVETRYLSSFRLVPGLHPFLDRMATSRLPVAAVGNQPRAWGDRLRRMAALDHSVSSWMVSGDVGSMLPEPALFEATRRTMSVDLYDCFYLSNVPAHLDAARDLGMATGLFLTDEEVAPDTDHTVVRGFEDLLRSRATAG